MDRLYACKCGAAGSDQGELDDHLLEHDPEQHWPMKSSHVTDRARQHAEEARQHGELRQRLADAVGMSVDEIREALR